VGRLAHSTEYLSPHSEGAKSLETHHVMPNPQDALLTGPNVSDGGERNSGSEGEIEIKRLNESGAVAFLLTEHSQV